MPASPRPNHQRTQGDGRVERVLPPDLRRLGHLVGRRVGPQLQRRRDGAGRRAPPLLLRRGEVAPPVGGSSRNERACALVCGSEGAMVEGRGSDGVDAGRGQLKGWRARAQARAAAAGQASRQHSASQLPVTRSTGSSPPTASQRRAPSHPPESLRCHVMWRPSSGTSSRMLSGRPMRASASSGSATWRGRAGRGAQHGDIDGEGAACGHRQRQRKSMWLHGGVKALA